MQLPKLYSERLENNVNDGGTLEEETGNIGLIWLSFVLISLRVKVYRKIPRIFRATSYLKASHAVPQNAFKFKFIRGIINTCIRFTFHTFNTFLNYLDFFLI